MNKMILLIVLLAIFVVSGAMPELNHIKDKIPNINDFGDPVFRVGEMCIADDLSIIVKNVEIIDAYGVPNGAKLLCVNIEVKNIGKVATHADTLQNPILLGMNIEDKNRFKLNYAGSTIYADGIIRDNRIDHIEWKGFGNIYPGIVKNGWVYFEVPAQIDLSATLFETYGKKWILSN